MSRHHRQDADATAENIAPVGVRSSEKRSYSERRAVAGWIRAARVAAAMIQTEVQASRSQG